MTCSQNTSTTPAPLSLRKNMLWNSVGSIVNLGCLWVITILIVRLSSNYDAAGVFSLAMSVFGIFSPIAEYRMYIYQVSDVKNENTTGEYFSFRLITCALSVVLCMVYAVFTCAWSALPAIFLYCVYKIVSFIIDVLHAQYQMSMRMDYIGVSLALQGVVSLAVFAAVFMPTQNLELTLAAMTVGVVVVGLLYDAPHIKRFTRIKLGISRKKIAHLLVFCAPIVIGFVACATAPSLPRQYLFAFSGEAALGIYASVSAPVAIIQAGASYLYSPLMGLFANAFHDGNKKEFMSLFGKATASIVAFGVVCLLGLVLLGGPLLTLMFGASIEPYLYLIPLVAVSSITIAFMGFFNGLMLTLRNSRGAFLGGAAALVCSAASTIPFVQLWGMNGVSVVLLLFSAASALVMGAFMVATLRKGFTSVPTEMLTIEDMHEIQLELMDEIDRICRANNLHYVLAYGSCLGAMRHKGFIPWDDDLDILMPRADYEAFAEIFPKENRLERFKLTNYRDRGSTQTYYKLVDTETFVEEVATAKKYGTGVWIDIFPLDNDCSELRASDRKINLLKALRFLSITKINSGSSLPIRVAKIFACPVLRCFGPYSLAARIDALAQVGNAAPRPARSDVPAQIENRMGGGTTHYVDVLGGDSTHDVYPVEWFEPMEVEFEEHVYFVPKHYDEFLTAVFGDWRTPPSNPKDRQPHSVVAYRLNR